MFYSQIFFGTWAVLRTHIRYSLGRKNCRRVAHIYSHCHCHLNSRRAYRMTYK